MAAVAALPPVAPAHVEEPAHVEPPPAVNGAHIEPPPPVKEAAMVPPPVGKVPAAEPAAAPSDWTSAAAAKEAATFSREVNIEQLSYDPKAERYVNGTVFSLLNFGTWLKWTLDDIYSRIRILQKADPTLVKLQLDLQNYNRVVRAYNGSVKGLSEPLRTPKKLVQDSKKNWSAVNIFGMPPNIEAVNKLLDPERIRLLDELDYDSARLPGASKGTDDFLQTNPENRARQLRIALGLTPWPINLNIY